MIGSDTSRAEAFSDAVIAIVITLLVLELQPPETEPGGARGIAGSMADILGVCGLLHLLGRNLAQPQIRLHPNPGDGHRPALGQPGNPRDARAFALAHSRDHRYSRDGQPDR